MSDDTQQNSNTSSILKHLAELRWRLWVSVCAFFICFLISYACYPFLLEALVKPLKIKVNYHSLIEPFLFKMRLSLYGAIALSSPVHLYNLVAFIFPGLLPHERRIAGWCIATSAVLTIAGLIFCYFYVIPWVAAFMLDPAFNPEGNVGWNINITDTILLEMKLFMAFVVLFQIPIILEILMAMDLVSRRTLLRGSRYAIVIILILAAVFTPPDVLSQLAVAIPLTIFYFLAIFVAKLCGFGNTYEERVSNEADSGSQTE